MGFESLHCPFPGYSVIFLGTVDEPSSIAISVSNSDSIVTGLLLLAVAQPLRPQPSVNSVLTGRDSATVTKGSFA